MSFTFRDLMQALEQDIFKDNSSNSFEVQCRKRELELKNIINILGIMIQHHLQKPGLVGKLSHWKKEKINNNIQNIVAYTDELYHKLNKQSIEENVKSKRSNLALDFGIEEEYLSFVLFHSYYGSVLNDINWIHDIPFHLSLGIAANRNQVEELGQLLPNRITGIKQFIKKDKKLFSRFNFVDESIDELFSCYDNKLFSAFNVLCLVIIERIVRMFGAYLVKTNDIEVDVLSKKYNSLDSFLRKIPWKKEIEYCRSSAMLWSSNSFKYAEKSQEDSPFIQERLVKLNFKQRLDFLRRRFKENRDLVVHGQEHKLNSDWQCYINASALHEVLNAVLEFGE